MVSSLDATLKYNERLSKFAFNLNLRRYTEVDITFAKVARVKGERRIGYEEFLSGLAALCGTLGMTFEEVAAKLTEAGAAVPGVGEAPGGGLPGRGGPRASQGQGGPRASQGGPRESKGGGRNLQAMRRIASVSAATKGLIEEVGTDTACLPRHPLYQDPCVYATFFFYNVYRAPRHSHGEH